MKKHLLYLFCILLVAFASYAFHLHGSGVAGGGASYSDVVIYYNYENTTTLDKSSWTDQAVTITGDFDNTGSPPKGDYWMDCPNDSDYITIDAASGEFDTASGRIAFYLTIHTGQDGLMIFDAATDGSNLLRIRLDGTNGRHIELWYEANGDDAFFDSDTFELSVDTTYFVEVKYDQPNNDFAIIVDGDTKNTGTMDNSSNTWQGTSPSNVHQGKYGTGAADLHTDCFLISDDDERDLYAIRALTSYPD